MYKTYTIPENEFIDLNDYPLIYGTGIVDDHLFSPDINVNIETQRGCNFRCAYCSYPSNFPTIRYRNLDDVFIEVQAAYRRGSKYVRFSDANFLSDKVRALKLLDMMIENKINMSFMFEAHPAFIDDTVSNKLKEYLDNTIGTTIEVGIGLQTLNKDALKIVRRSTKMEQFVLAFHLLTDAGVIIETSIITGLPRETLKSWYNTLEFVSELMRNGHNQLSIMNLWILPNTEMEELVSTENLVVEGNSHHFVYSTPTMPRKDLVQAFRLNSVAVRIFSTINKEERIKLRNWFFQLVDKFDCSPLVLLKYFVHVFDYHLQNTGSSFVHPDFPRGQLYWDYDVFKEISDRMLCREFNRLEEIYESL